MDRVKETADVLIDINKYKNNLIEDYTLIKSVCGYFDKIKNEELNSSDFNFLKYISNAAGIPHFFDILHDRFDQSNIINSYDLNTFSSIIYESTLHTDEKNKLHKYQKIILDKFHTNSLNRFFLSASTSFGKTHVVFEIIKKMKYNNIVLIFPTIALLSENLERLISDDNYTFFKDNYTIHTLSEIENFGKKNLFIYTPERFLSYNEKNQHNLNFDFSFVDEVYKIDNEYIIDEETKENERDVAYRLAVHYCLSNNSDILLAGPYIEFYSNDNSSYNNSFDNFLVKNKIKLLDFNNYEIVNKSYNVVKSAKVNTIDDNLTLVYTSKNKTQRLVQTVNQLSLLNQNSIVYCANRGKTGGVEGYALSVIDSNIFTNHNIAEYLELVNHISKNFSEDWVLVKGLANGVGIHHGLIPKYIQKEIIYLFNKGFLKVLISTTTITEGVNTSAKNLIVMHNKKGNKDLKKFDAKNIAGRAGRFGYHFNGRVIVIQNDFMNTINSNAEGIKHKNYDETSVKDEIDLFYSDDEYLTENDKKIKVNILEEQKKRNLPNELFDMYKIISRLDKIKIYDLIMLLSADDLALIKKLIRTINYKMDIDYGGFQVILDTIAPIVKNKNLIFLIENKGEEGITSTLTHLVHYYLKGGFKGSINYHLQQGDHIDKAISKTSKFVYNTLKYQVVKYLGVFNLIYKYIESVRNRKEMTDVSGIDKLLLKFEYNAITNEGRIASDYGVPSKVLSYYENPDNKIKIKESFDDYEIKIYHKINEVINR